MRKKGKILDYLVFVFVTGVVWLIFRQLYGKNSLLTIKLDTISNKNLGSIVDKNLDLRERLFEIKMETDHLDSEELFPNNHRKLNKFDVSNQLMVHVHRSVINVF